MIGLYGFVTKLLVSGNFQFKQGEIDLLGSPMAILSMRTLKQMNDDAIRHGPESVNDLYFEGWVFGYTFTKRLADAFNLKKFEERYKVVMEIAAMIGFGDFKTVEFYPGFAKYNVFSNPFSLQYPKGSGLVDNLLRGMNAGGSTVVHERIMNCLEFECCAETRTRCQFISASQENLKKMVKPEFIRTQIDLDYVIPKQMALLKELGVDADGYLKLSENSALANTPPTPSA